MEVVRLREIAERERDEARRQRDELLDAAHDCRKGLDAEIMEHCLTSRLKDEALAQVAVLVQALENVLYAQLGGHLNPTDDGKKVLNTIRPLQSQTPREARARALLDRLQRAEAVVEAAKQYRERFTALSVVGANGTKDIAGVPREVHDAILNALAAWEEGKA